MVYYTGGRFGEIDDNREGLHHEKKTTRRQVLLSFLGTTDPIRGERDGAMLHILRHYRPEVVCLLFTPEVRKLAEADERYEKVFFHLKSHWDGYAPMVLEQDFPSAMFPIWTSWISRSTT